jgi:hypothetical protein
MIDRFELFHRWQSAALMIGTRAAGGTQNLQPDTITGSHERPSAPNNSDLMERQELSGGMIAWLTDMGPLFGARVDEQMHEAITRANEKQASNLLGRIERVEWLLKVTWEFGKHRHLTAKESNVHGIEDHERSIIMGYRGQHTRDVAHELKTTEGSIRWLRRKHGLSIKGERIYPCTSIAGDDCVACGSLNEYGDDYMEQEAA